MQIPSHLADLAHLFATQHQGIGKPPIDPSQPFEQMFYALADRAHVNHMAVNDYKGERTAEALAEYFGLT